MARAPKSTGIALFPLLLLAATASALPLLNSSLPDPAAVVADFHSKVATSRRRIQETGGGGGDGVGGCMTGNPIDDCWRCAGTDWRQDRQRLADCGIGFGRNALGGKGGPLYVVTDSSDRDPVNPAPGTLRHAAIQEGPLWIVFASSMTIRLSEELLVNSYKTIDGRGADVHIGAGGACITLQYVSNVIIHNVHVHDCVPAGNANVRSTPTHYGWRTRSDGDGISLFGARDVWVDHCALWRCADGLVDAIMGSTAITVSNSYFAHHNEVMLLGASDAYLPDSGMQVTIAFNRFGPGLVQRMPRCRRGYFHIVNNDYTSWQMYAIGGSASPTINSQGNRYIAPADPNAKEVTKRVDTAEGQWTGWNWRTEGDMMVNGAFFVPSGEGMEDIYGKASSTDPKSSALVDALTQNAGVFGDPRPETQQEGGTRQRLSSRYIHFWSGGGNAISQWCPWLGALCNARTFRGRSQPKRASSLVPVPLAGPLSLENAVAFPAVRSSPWRSLKLKKPRSFPGIEPILIPSLCTRDSGGRSELHRRSNHAPTHVQFALVQHRCEYVDVAASCGGNFCRRR